LCPKVSLAHCHFILTTTWGGGYYHIHCKNAKPRCKKVICSRFHRVEVAETRFHPYQCAFVGCGYKKINGSCLCFGQTFSIPHPKFGCFLETGSPESDLPFPSSSFLSGDWLHCMAGLKEFRTNNKGRKENLDPYFIPCPKMNFI
jgi:hypothetical protein